MSSRPPYGHRMKIPRKKGVSWRAEILVAGERSQDVPEGLVEEFSAGSREAVFRPFLDSSADSGKAQSEPNQ